MPQQTTEALIYRYEDWHGGGPFVEAMRSGTPVRIDEEVYWYWLEALPPIYMGREATLPDGRKVRAAFGFAEGREHVVAFWKEGGGYWCCRTDEMNPRG